LAENHLILWAATGFFELVPCPEDGCFDGEAAIGFHAGEFRGGAWVCRSGAMTLRRSRAESGDAAIDEASEIRE
jgi:hypothetical protein